MKIKLFIKKLLIIFGPLAGGFIIGLLTNNKAYKLMKKPFLSPPSIVFPIAWSLLYLLMGISLYLVLKKSNNYKAVKTFIIQLILNYIWPFLFFNLKIYNISAIWIVLLIYFVIKMIKEFKAINPLAGYLQIPYLIWLFFALYLNIGVAILN